ncbi:hypothetical protein NC653_006797 [Populus alba x Populus x berolinensis]|uniref:Uncharacterized protein n=1 Tax=Populus alba x Populus x berolinensis TaxID=444605 RepID=A0AAD6RGQ0_9ROSI|nr:hypothetical protein NC653_006797 [Populus alba x Populus x berolinensis]
MAFFVGAAIFVAKFLPENAATNSEGSLIVPDETPMNEFEVAVPLFSDVLMIIHGANEQIY